MFGLLKKKKPVSNIKADQMQKMMSLPNHAIIDVRTKGEFNASHINGAMNLNVQNLSFRKQVKALDPDKTYLVYCRSGKRSMIACKMMQSNGVKNVHNLSGGIISWPYKKV